MVVANVNCHSSCQVCQFDGCINISYILRIIRTVSSSCHALCHFERNKWRDGDGSAPSHIINLVSLFEILDENPNNVYIYKKAFTFLKRRRKIQKSFLRFPTKERTTATAINQVL